MLVATIIRWQRTRRAAPERDLAGGPGSDRGGVLDIETGRVARGGTGSMGDQGDADLARRAAAGDRDAFAELFGRERDGVVRLCARMLADPSAAEDAASEVFLRARRALRRYDESRPFKSWVLSIASHYCIDQLRRRSLEARLFTTTEPEDGRLSDSAPDPLRRLASREEQRRVLVAIDRLPARHRLPLVMRFYQELDYAEIGSVLGIPRSQVGSLLYRSKRALRLALEESHDRSGEMRR